MVAAGPRVKSLVRPGPIACAGGMAETGLGVRGDRSAFGHLPAEADAALAPGSTRAAAREPVDRITAPLSWYSGVPQTIANGALWCGVTWVLTRDRRAAAAPAAALALETACFVASAALVRRPRPSGVWRPEHPHATSSFPSGHTAAAFALHGTLADLLDRRCLAGASGSADAATG